MVQGANMIVLSGLMLGGLIAAQSMGIKTASGALTLANKAGSKTKAFALNRAKRGGARLRDKTLTAGRKTDEAGETTSAAQRLAARAVRIPGAGRLFRGTEERIGKRVQEAKGRVEERQKGLANATDAGILHRANTVTAAANSEDAAAVMAEAASRGLTSQINPDQLNRLIEAVRTTHAEDLILTSRPDLASNFGQDIGEVTRNMKPDKKLDIDKEAFEHLEVTLNLNTPDLTRIGNGGSADQRNEIVNTVRKAMDTPSVLAPELRRNLQRIDDFITQNANYQT